MLQKGRVSNSFPVAVAQRRGGCGSHGRWDRAEIARAMGGGRPARATPPLLRCRGPEAAAAWDPNPEPVSAPSRANRRPHWRISRIGAARQRFRGWEDGEAEAVEERAAPAWAPALPTRGPGRRRGGSDVSRCRRRRSGSGDASPAPSSRPRCRRYLSSKPRARTGAQQR
jgi:hypothetical protein